MTKKRRLELAKKLLKGMYYLINNTSGEDKVTVADVLDIISLIIGNNNTSIVELSEKKNDK